MPDATDPDGDGAGDYEEHSEKFYKQIALGGWSVTAFLAHFVRLFNSGLKGRDGSQLGRGVKPHGRQLILVEV